MSATILQFPPKPTTKPKAKRTRTKAKTDPNDQARYESLARVAHTALCDLGAARDMFPEGTVEHTCVDMAYRVLVPLFTLASSRAYPKGKKP